MELVWLQRCCVVEALEAGRYSGSLHDILVDLSDMAFLWIVMLLLGPCKRRGQGIASLS